MKSILIITGSFYPAQEGGPTITLYWLASGLAYAGYQVKVLASNKGLNGQSTEDIWTTLNGFSVMYATPNKRKEVISSLISECDCLIRSGVCNLSTHVSNLLWLRRGKHIILSPRGELFEPALYHKGKLYGLLKVLLFKIVGRLYGKRIVYHATSQEEVEQIRCIMGQFCNIELIPNYMILPDRVYLQRKMIDHYFLFVGRIAPIKALENLILALDLSKAFRESDYYLQLVGNNVGAYYESLCVLINTLNLQSKVIFRGVKVGVEKDTIMAGAKCLFLVSRSENFGNVVIEALAQGTPVVASTGTPWQELVAKKAGYWIDNSPESIAKILDELINMKDEEYGVQRESALQLSREFDIYNKIDEWVRVIG